MEEIKTFWNVLQHFGIEIPPIQRDYAQGRETSSANKIRENFLNAIFNALEKGQALPLDFVYGKVYGLRNEEEYRRNKNAIQSLINSVKDYALTVDLTLKNIVVEDKSTDRSELVYLIPLDGQQRLTTLFLIHWYIAKRLKKKDELAVLSKFRYKTRKSSSSFLKLLTNENLNFDFKKDSETLKDLKEGKFYNEILDLEYFSSSWLNDPTVRAILIVLQEIHIRLQEYENDRLTDYWISITQKNLLSFDFLDLKGFNLSDELYVKMNARGKQLSSFENFKAWLFGIIKEDNLLDELLWNEYSKKFDIEWNDIFWNRKLKGTYDVDDAYFNFFKLMFLYDTIKVAELNGTNFNPKTNEFFLIDIINNNKPFDWEISSDLIKKNISNYLNFLSYFEDFVPNDNYLNDFFNFFFSERGIRPSWQNLVKIYITFSFISHKEKSLNLYDISDFEQLKDYQRILYNLFDNTNIDNPSLYQSAILEIDKMNASLKSREYSISDWIEKMDYSSKSVFTEQQTLEEILKFRLLSDREWKELIYEAENISYFERQLNFWFFKTDISLSKQEFTKDILDSKELKNKFLEITNKINKLFNEKGIDRTNEFSERIFERALLSKSDYLLNEKGYKCFGRNSGRDVSWKRLFFRDRNTEKTNTALLEVFDLDFINVKNTFEKYIEKNISDGQFEKWRKTFIQNKKLFEYLGDLKYIRNINVHGWVMIKDSYKTYTGAHYELFSLDFYTKHLSESVFFLPFTERGYYSAPKNNKDDFPCAYLNWKTDNFNYALDIKFIYEKYCLIFFSREKAISTEIKDKLLELNFTNKSDYFLKNLDNEIETLEELKNLCLELNNLNQ